VLAAAGWVGWHVLRGRHDAAHRAVRTCVTPTPAPVPAQPGDVTVAVLNATAKVGLAHQVAAALHAQGFRIGRVGNTKAVVAGTATVAYAPGDRAVALAVAEHVTGATLTPVSSGRVTLELGPGFTVLAPQAEVSAAHARDVTAASPRPAVCSSS